VVLVKLLQSQHQLLLMLLCWHALAGPLPSFHDDAEVLLIQSLGRHRFILQMIEVIPRTNGIACTRCLVSFSDPVASVFCTVPEVLKAVLQRHSTSLQANMLHATARCQCVLVALPIIRCPVMVVTSVYARVKDPRHKVFLILLNWPCVCWA